MPIKVYKPTTPARRKTSVLLRDNLSKKRPEKSLVIKKIKKGGRNNKGRITVRHQGGGARQYIRIVDFKRDKFDIVAKVQSIEYDPNRNASIALLFYIDGEKRYIIAPEGLKAGDKVISSLKKTPIKPGNCLPLKKIPTGTQVYNVELSPLKGGQLARAAGNYLIFSSLANGLAQLKMPSGEVRLVPEDCLASIGVPSNSEYRNIRIGKAGRKRHMGIKPTVRGKAMNPVDHPHGGGEGSNPIGLKQPKTFKGKRAFGIKTRKNKKSSNRLIVQRRPSKTKRKV